MPMKLPTNNAGMKILPGNFITILFEGCTHTKGRTFEKDEKISVCI